MKTPDYDYIEECFDKLLFDYQCAQNEIIELKETIAALKGICAIHHIDISSLEDKLPF